MIVTTTWSSPQVSDLIAILIDGTSAQIRPARPPS
jgi:hypothetical protein